MQSSLEPTGRHIVLTLLSRTEVTSAEIPPQYVPSFSDLECLTGYSRSTLSEWMKALIDSHWVARVDTEGSSRQAIRLSIGDPSVSRPKRSRTTKKADPSYRQAVRTSGTTIPPGGTERTAERYSTMPPGGTAADPHLLKGSPTENPIDHIDLDQPATSADDSDDGTLGVHFGEPVAPKPRTPQKVTKKSAPKKASEEETRGQRLNRVTKLYTDHVKPSSFFKARAVIESAFDANFTEEQICAGIAKLVEKEDPLTKDSIRIAIKGPPSWATRDLNSNQTPGFIRMFDSNSPDRDYSEPF
jgi:hypothetical protein